MLGLKFGVSSLKLLALRFPLLLFLGLDLMVSGNACCDDERCHYASSLRTVDMNQSDNGVLAEQDFEHNDDINYVTRNRINHLPKDLSFFFAFVDMISALLTLAQAR